MGGKTGTTTSKVTIPPEVLARYNSVNTQAQNVAATPFQQYSTDPNAFVAPLNSTQQAGVAGANAAAGLAQPYYQAATGAMGAGLGAAVPFAYGSGAAVNPSDINGGVINKYMSPYLRTVLGTTVAAENQQNAQQRSQMQGNAISAGAFGGDRANVGLANLAYQQGLANNQTNANILNTGYGQALSTAQQQQGVDLSAQQANRAALGQAGQSLYNEFTGYGQGLAGLGTGAQTAAEQGVQGQLAAGQVGQQTQQAGLSALYNQFLQQQSYPFQVAQFLANIAEGTGALSGSTTSTTQPTPFFSDERLKEGIEPIGRTYDGQKIVKFRYRGKPETHIGLLAQDVEKHHPEAVGQSQGYKTVDYDAATEDAAKKYAGGVVNLDEYRKHYLGGGLVDPTDLRAILAQQAQMYNALPFAANGTYGSPMASSPRGGATGIVPSANLHVPALTVAKAPSSSPQSGMSQLAGLASTINTGKSLGESAESLVDAAGRGVDRVRGMMGISAENPQNQTQTSFPTPPIPPDYTPEARGGVVPFRRHRADGGFDPSDPNADATPEDIYKPKMGLNIPQEDPHAKLATANAPSGSSSQASGLGSTLKDAASIVGAAKTLGSAAGGIGSWIGDTVLPFLALKDGGLVPRHGYASDGTVEDLPLPPPAPDPADMPTGVSPRRVDAFERAVNRTLGFEGGYNPRDSNGYPVNHGINQQANPDVDVRNLTQEDAKNLYRTRYWNAINGDSLAAQNPDLAHIAFDTAALAGPRQANELIAQANGDPNKLLDLRQQFQNGLIQREPTKYGPYANSWNRRVEALRGDIGGTSGTVPSASAASAPTGGVAPPAAPDATDGGNLYATTDNGASDNVRAYHDLVAQRLAEQQNPSWFSRNKEWLTPVLSGLGAMASSNSRYLGAAALQGLGAGATTAANMDYKTQAQNSALTEQAGRSVGLGEGLPAVQAKAAQAAFFMGPNNIPMVVTKQFGTIPYYEWQRRGRPATIAEGATAPDRAPLPAVPPASPADAAPTQPTRAADPSQYSFQVPIGQAGQAMMNDERAMLERGVTPQDQELAAKHVNDARVAAAQAQTSRQQLLEQAQTMVRPNGILTTGSGINTRADYVRFADTIYRMFGGTDSLTPDMANHDISTKLANAASAAQAANMGERAASAMDLLSRGLANNTLTPEAIKAIMADTMVAQQRQIDRGAYASRYENQSEGNLRLGRNVDQAFNADYNQDFYNKQRAALLDLMTPRQQAAGLSGFHYILGSQQAQQHPELRRAFTPANIEAAYGPGVYRYFRPAVQ